MIDIINFQKGKGWNRSRNYINKIKRIQDKMLRDVLPYGEKYIKEEGENENG